MYPVKNKSSGGPVNRPACASGFRRGPVESGVTSNMKTAGTEPQNTIAVISEVKTLRVPIPPSNATGPHAKQNMGDVQSQAVTASRRYVTFSSLLCCNRWPSNRLIPVMVAAVPQPARKYRGIGGTASVVARSANSGSILLNKGRQQSTGKFSAGDSYCACGD